MKRKMLHKREGETPLECLERFRAANPEYKDLPMTYAGRLDPMASGKILILIGDECKNKEKYLGLDKEYDVEVLFGFATDSHDVLGKITKIGNVAKFDIRKAQTSLQGFVKKFVQKYPKYSSKRIAKSKNLRPKNVEIYSIKFISSRNVLAKPLLKQIERKIAKVAGNFRQSEIIKLWQKHLQKNQTKFPIIKIKVFCSSGTYMRSLAHNLGKKLGTAALAFGIKRTKVGNYEI